MTMATSDNINNELAVGNQGGNPRSMIERAIDSGAGIETLERLMTLEERWKTNTAREAYGHALAEFQQEMPAIHKGRSADRFNFASFDDIMKRAKPLLGKHGIAISFDSKHTDDGTLTVTCNVRVGGYHEGHTFTVPVPKTLKVSDAQQYGAALSYAKRYCLCAALNIVVTDEDDENRLNADQPISKEQWESLESLIEEKGVDREKFLEWAKVERTEDLPVKLFDRAMRLLEQKGNGR